jgi:hypothetical protein
VLAQAVAAKVERDRPQALEQRDDPKPVRGIAGQAVQQHDRMPLPGLGVGEPVRPAILRPPEDAYPAPVADRPRPGGRRPALGLVRMHKLSRDRISSIARRSNNCTPRVNDG